MLASPAISIVMPTYNRADAIGLTLEHLARQSLSAGQFEVVVVDDGSTDATADVVASVDVPFHLAYLQQQNRGAAAARNAGVRQASADLILFLDSDVIPDALLLEAHLESHAGSDRHLVVGRVKPWPSAISAWYERVLDPDGVGMDYGEQERLLPFYMTLGGNFSMTKTSFSQIGGYDETFPAAGCEETEFAYRAGLLGLELFYQPRAVAYHNHPRTLSQRCRQQQAHMRSMALLIAKHPELQTVIHGVDELMPFGARPCSLQATVRRSRAALCGWLPVRFALRQGLLALNHLQAFPRLASLLFWGLRLGWRWAGFRQGWKRYALESGRAVDRP